jgi:RNA polymerase sigma factor (sigma-70 family)
MAVEMRDFEGFFGAEYLRVLRSLTLVLGDRQRAEDAAQEAFARAYRRWSAVGHMERPGTWVYVVALRAERRRLARDANRPDVELEAVDASGVDDAIDRVWVVDALAKLSPRQRCAIVLRYYADLPVTDVAEAMGCAPGTVKATLHAALERLQVRMSADAAEEVPSAN